MKTIPPHASALRIGCHALSTAIMLATPIAAPSQPIRVAPELARGIDSIFAQWDVPGSPGAAVGVVRDGELVFARGYGSAQIEYGVPITPATPFHVASEAKQFTATAVLLLARRGLLALDDEVRTYLPEVPDFGVPITIRHLLNHSSGLRDQWQALALAGRGGRDVITTDHVLRMVERQRALNFAPGETELYCNTGFTLLAEIVSRVSGESFAAFTRREIFEPLGMERTRFLDDVAETIPDRAYSYGPGDDDGFERRILNYAAPGATSLWTTVEDFARWLINLDHPTVGDRVLFERLTVADTLSDGAEVEWGYGMTAGRHRGFLRYGHGGGDAGFRAYAVRFPDVDLGVVVLANLSTINPGPFGSGALALQVADLFLPDDIAVRELRTADAGTDGPEVDLDPYVGTYEDPGGRIVNVVSEFGTLKLWTPSRAARIALDPRSKSEFEAAADSIAGVSFVWSDSAVHGIVIRHDGTPWTGVRVDPIAHGVEEFAGSYYSDELQTIWTLAAADGDLVARHIMHDDIRLSPVVRDLFDGDAWFLGEVRFIRDDDGRVTGFDFSADRIKRVEFHRLPR